MPSQPPPPAACKKCHCPGVWLDPYGNWFCHSCQVPRSPRAVRMLLILSENSDGQFSWANPSFQKSENSVAEKSAVDQEKTDDAIFGWHFFSWDISAEKTAAKLTNQKSCRCGSEKFVDVKIHGGESVRRDCARCGRFFGFPVWCGRAVQSPAEVNPNPLAP